MVGAKYPPGYDLTYGQFILTNLHIVIMKCPPRGYEVVQLKGYY